MAKIKFEWEMIIKNRDSFACTTTQRAPIVGGWIVKDTWWEDENGICQSMIFISDPAHQWEI